MKAEVAWLGKTYLEEILWPKYKLNNPTWKLVKEGVGKEAAEQIKQTMGDVFQQNLVVEAMKNMMDTWHELCDLAGVKDQNAALEAFELNE